MRAYVLLGHAHLDGIIDNDCHLRIKVANQISTEERRSSLLVLSGGAKSSHDKTEANQIKEHLISCENLILEEHSTTTAENAWCVVPLLPPDVTQIKIICSRAHSFRAYVFFRLALRYYGRKIKISFLYSPSPSVRSWFYELRYLHHIPRNRKTAITMAKAIFE